MTEMTVSGKHFVRIGIVGIVLILVVVPFIRGNTRASLDQERLFLLARVPWEATYTPLPPFHAEDLTVAVLRLLPLDVVSSKGLDYTHYMPGKWLGVVRIIGGLDEGVVWIAFRRDEGKEGSWNMSVVSARIEKLDGDEQRPGDLLITPELLKKHVHATVVPTTDLDPHGRQELVDAIEFCRSGCERRILPMKSYFTVDTPVVEVRLVGGGNELYLDLGDSRSVYRRRILRAVRDLLPSKLLPFPIVELEKEEPAPKDLWHGGGLPDGN